MKSVTNKINTENAAFVEGPWRTIEWIGKEGELNIGVIADSRSVAYTTGRLCTRPGRPGRDDSIARQRANARLIAAAPDLLAALLPIMDDASLNRLDDNPDGYAEIVMTIAERNAAREAIAKATK